MHAEKHVYGENIYKWSKLWTSLRKSDSKRQPRELKHTDYPVKKKVPESECIIAFYNWEQRYIIYIYIYIYIYILLPIERLFSCIKKFQWLDTRYSSSWDRNTPDSMSVWNPKLKAIIRLGIREGILRHIFAYIYSY